MPDARCDTCRYADPVVLDAGPIDDGGPALICRRFPPLVVFDGVELSKISPQVDGRRDWCGEYSPVPS